MASSEEDAVARFVNNGHTGYIDEHSNNTALTAYMSNHHGSHSNHKYYDSSYDTSMSSDDNKNNHRYDNHNGDFSSSDDHDSNDDISSIGTMNNDKDETNRKALNIFNPQSPFNQKDEVSTERHSLLQKDAFKDMHGRLLREKVMRNHKYYYSALKSFHIWSIVFVTSLDHLLRKYFEYFAYFICTTSFIGVTFYEISWSVAALDFAAMFASSFILPFVITKSPHFVQFSCQIFIGMSMLFIVWWHSFIGLFVLRFIFGMGYILILSNWSACISTFVSPSKQSSAIGKIDLSWAFASFFFILCAYIMDNYSINYIFYILSIIAILSSLVLFSIMPSQKLIRTEIHSHNFMKHLLSMIRLVFFQHFPTGIFLLVIGIITFINSSLTLLLAPWLSMDYNLSITEFGYCTVIIGTAQVVAIIFSYQFGNKLGVGWSLLAGILVQLLMFILILLLNNNGILYPYIASSLVESEGDSEHYTFPLLFILLILAIHFIAAEFTYINAVTCMLHIAPIHIISSKTIAANSMRFVTSICRILGAIFAPYFWYYSLESIQLFILIAVILFGIAFIFHLGLMLYIACCVWDKNNESEEYMMVSSNGDNNYYQKTDGYDSSNSNEQISSYMFEQDIDYPNINRSDDEMDDEYIAKILSTNIDFTLM